MTALTKFFRHPLVRRVAVTTAAALFVTSLIYGWLVWRPVEPSIPDTVSPAALDATLRPDASLPISFEHTDVLMLATCTIRRDRMGIYGHAYPTTPFLDALAEQGVVFDEHFSQAPWTRPAMGAMLTGRWPRVLKLDNPAKGKGFTAILHEDHTLLSELLAAQGYTAVGAVANPNLKTRFGFAQGFSAYMEPERTYKEGTPIPEAAEIVQNALDMASEVSVDKRLYLRVTMLDTHLPQRYSLHYPKLFNDQPRRLWMYDAALRTIDSQVARLVTELRKTRPNLLVVFAADHGEGLYLPRHHGPEHGNYVYRTTVQTPWIVYHPALPSPGRRIQGPSMNVDILPTIADMLGIAPPPEVDGASQRDAVLGRTDRARHTYAYSETFFRRKHLSTVYDGTHQLIREYDGPRETGPHGDALFTAEDWKADQDIASQLPEITRTLGAVLDTWEAQNLMLANAAPEVRNDDVDEGTNDMLRELGYVED